MNLFTWLQSLHPWTEPMQPLPNSAGKQDALTPPDLKILILNWKILLIYLYTITWRAPPMLLHSCHLGYMHIHNFPQEKPAFCFLFWLQDGPHSLPPFFQTFWRLLAVSEWWLVSSSWRASRTGHQPRGPAEAGTEQRASWNWVYSWCGDGMEDTYELISGS